MNLPLSMTPKEQVNYLIVIGFDECHEQIETGMFEPAETWVKFLGECATSILLK